MDVAVVICAYTEERWEQLVDAVASIERQTKDARLAIVVDHNPTLLDLARRRWPDHVVTENQHAQGLSGARNTGVAMVDGDIVMFLDDDAVAEPDWIDAMQRPFDDDRVGLVGGLVQADWATAQPSWFPDEFLWVVGCSYRGLPTVAARIRNPIGASMAVRRDVFDRVGGFAIGIGRIGKIPLGCEETELSIRASTAGYEARYEPAAVVFHHVPAERATFAYFVRRCLAEGRSKAVVSREVGRGPTLESERAYVSRTLPSAAGHRLRRMIGGPRSGAIGGIAAIVVGCAAAGFGFFTTLLRTSGAVHGDRGRRDLPAGRPT